MPSNCTIPYFAGHGSFGEVTRPAPKIFWRNAFHNDLGNIDARNFNERQRIGDR